MRVAVAALQLLCLSACGIDGIVQECYGLGFPVFLETRQSCKDIENDLIDARHALAPTIPDIYVAPRRLPLIVVVKATLDFQKGGQDVTGYYAYYTHQVYTNSNHYSLAHELVHHWEQYRGYSGDYAMSHTTWERYPGSYKACVATAGDPAECSDIGVACSLYEKGILRKNGGWR